MPSEVGLGCKFYRNTGTYAVPVWTAIGTVREATLALTKALADISARTSDIRLQRSTLKEMPLEVTLVRHNTTAAKTEWAFFYDAWWSGNVIDIQMLDGAITDSGSSGVRGEFEVVDFSRAEPLEDAVTSTVKLVPRITNNGPPVVVNIP
jgi:hypothetical protein